MTYDAVRSVRLDQGKVCAVRLGSTRSGLVWLPVGLVPSGTTRLGLVRLPKA